MARKQRASYKFRVPIGELALMLVGIFVGWLVGRGFTAFLLAVPIAFFIGLVYEYIEGNL